jgi:putative transposase
MAERKPYAKVPLHRDANRLGPQEHDAGASFVDLGRRHGVHPNTIANWQSKYGGMESSELARARAVEVENVRMRRIIANLSLENDAMKQLIEKLLEPSSRKKRGEGPPRTWLESARRVSHHGLRAFRCAVPHSSHRRSTYGRAS